MLRLVTPEDIQKYPQLISQGVSPNMNYDFSDLEAEENDLAGSEEQSIETEEKALKNHTPKKEPKKAAPVKKAAAAKKSTGKK